MWFIESLLRLYEGLTKLLGEEGRGGGGLK